MKRIQVAIAVLIGGLVATAYGTCYLQQVVCCIQGGTDLGSATMCGGSTESVVVDEDAWRFDTYSVTVGGASSPVAHTCYCDGSDIVGNNGEAFLAPPSGNAYLYGTTPPLGGGFEVHYWQCMAGQNTTANSEGYYAVTTHYLTTGSSGCN
jgi:hypothetical protein